MNSKHSTIPTADAEMHPDPTAVIITTLRGQPWALNMTQGLDFCGYLLGVAEGRVTAMTDLTIGERQFVWSRMTGGAEPEQQLAAWQLSREAARGPKSGAMLDAEAAAWLL